MGLLRQDRGILFLTVYRFLFLLFLTVYRFIFLLFLTVYRFFFLTVYRLFLTVYRFHHLCKFPRLVLEIYAFFFRPLLRFTVFSLDTFTGVSIGEV